MDSDTDSVYDSDNGTQESVGTGYFVILNVLGYNTAQIPLEYFKDPGS